LASVARRAKFACRLMWANKGKTMKDKPYRISFKCNECELLHQIICFEQDIQYNVSHLILHQTKQILIEDEVFAKELDLDDLENNVQTAMSLHELFGTKSEDFK